MNCEQKSGTGRKGKGKETFPPTPPYREKAREKKQEPLPNRKVLSRVCVSARTRVWEANRARKSKLWKAINAELDELAKLFRYPAYNRNVWAGIAWRVGVENFHYATMDYLAEVKDRRRPPKNFAADFHQFLNARFPKEGK